MDSLKSILLGSLLLTLVSATPWPYYSEQTGLFYNQRSAVTLVFDMGKIPTTEFVFDSSEMEEVYRASAEVLKTFRIFTPCAKYETAIDLQTCAASLPETMPNVTAVPYIGLATPLGSLNLLSNYSTILEYMKIDNYPRAMISKNYFFQNGYQVWAVKPFYFHAVASQQDITLLKSMAVAQQTALVYAEGLYKTNFPMLKALKDAIESSQLPSSIINKRRRRRSATQTQPSTLDNDIETQQMYVDINLKAKKWADGCQTPHDTTYDISLCATLANNRISRDDAIYFYLMDLEHKHDKGTRHRRGGASRKAKFAYKQSIRNAREIHATRNTLAKLSSNVQELGVNQVRIGERLAVHIDQTQQADEALNNKINVLAEETKASFEAVKEAMETLSTTTNRATIMMGYQTTLISGMGMQFIKFASAMVDYMAQNHYGSSLVASASDLYSGRLPASLISPLMIRDALDKSDVKAFIKEEGAAALFTVDSIAAMYREPSSSAILNMDTGRLNILVTIPLLKPSQEMILYTLYCLEAQFGEIVDGEVPTMMCSSQVPLYVAYTPDHTRYIYLNNNLRDCTFADVSYCNKPIIQRLVPTKPISPFDCEIAAVAQVYGNTVDMTTCSNNWKLGVMQTIAIPFNNQSVVLTNAYERIRLICSDPPVDEGLEKSPVTLLTLPESCRLSGDSIQLPGMAQDTGMIAQPVVHNVTLMDPITPLERAYSKLHLPLMQSIEINKLVQQQIHAPTLGKLENFFSDDYNKRMNESNSEIDKVAIAMEANLQQTKDVVEQTRAIANKTAQIKKEAEQQIYQTHAEVRALETGITTSYISAGAGGGVGGFFGMLGFIMSVYICCKNRTKNQLPFQ